MNREEQLEHDIKGLLLILKDTWSHEKVIHRYYMVDKLERILNNSMNFHPTIKKALKEKEKCAKEKEKGG